MVFKLGIEQLLYSRLGEILLIDESHSGIQTSFGSSALDLVTQGTDAFEAHCIGILNNQGIDDTFLRVADQAGRGIEADNFDAAPQSPDLNGLCRADRA